MQTIPESSSPARFIRAVREHPLAAFLMILYPVSWVLFLPALLGTEGFGLIGVDIPAQVGILLVTIFGLTGVAFMVTRIVDGKDGTRRLRRHYYQFRAGPQWYVLALLGAPVLLLCMGVAINGTGAFTLIARNAAQIPTVYLVNVVLIAILISVWEEGAWLAFVTARLQARLGALWASVLVAPLFGFIHFPLFLVTGGLIDNARPHGLEVIEYAFYLLVFFSVPVRIVMTWVYNSTRGSLPVVALLHASIDTTASGAVLLAFYPAVDGRLLYVGIAIVALVVVAATRGRLGYAATAPTADVPTPVAVDRAVPMTAPEGTS
jgi:membrane protease YdiL (CAAX protease family)